MADKNADKKGGLPPGVRGPSQPPPSTPPRQSPSGSTRRSVERASIPLLTKLLALPRWLIVVLMAVCLFLGLIQTGSLSWLGGLLLLVVGGFLGWLLLLSWPALTPARRATRLVVVAAVIGIAVLKFLGRF